jgi:aspartyl/asparaginyl beta-hydroxylase (cupin superfamily)
MLEKAQFFLSEEDVYTGVMPAYFNTKDYPWVKTLENHWEIIRDEFSEYIDGNKILEESSVNPPYLSHKGAWQNVYFWNFLWKKHENCSRFPKTYALLKTIPNISFAEVTCLNPKSKILPHIGETNITIRGHLGLKIPATLPTMGIDVSGEKKGWEDGKVVLFSDAHRHYVWNESNEKRFVLVFDVIQDDYASQKYWMCAQALSSLTIKLVDEHFPIFKKMPSFLLNSFHYTFSSLWYLYLPIQNKFSFLP